jgi:hypothetical protein
MITNDLNMEADPTPEMSGTQNVTQIMDDVKKHSCNLHPPISKWPPLEELSTYSSS